MSTHALDTGISRDGCYIMRGMAIIAIMLHNYCHIMPGVTLENEFSFRHENIASLIAFTGSFVEWIYEFFLLSVGMECPYLFF